MLPCSRWAGAAMEARGHAGDRAMSTAACSIDCWMGVVAGTARHQNHQMIQPWIMDEQWMMDGSFRE
jgi:hypothetical protein